jgi:hypothetical protein
VMIVGGGIMWWAFARHKMMGSRDTILGVRASIGPMICDYEYRPTDAQKRVPTHHNVLRSVILTISPVCEVGRGNYLIAEFSASVYTLLSFVCYPHTAENDRSAKD